ncbi:MAG: TRAP transporter large permease subunit [Enterocloster bolteae]
MEAPRLFRQFSTCGHCHASSMITPLIPPGVAMRFLYGSVANISIGKLFIAGIGPRRAIFCVAMMILVHFISKSAATKPMRREGV